MATEFRVLVQDVLGPAGDRIEPDPHHPRREGDETELDELAADIAIRGVLQPIVVEPADARGRHRLWFGGQRLKAAVRAGLSVVPVVITSTAYDGYAQIAEDLARAGPAPSGGTSRRGGCPGRQRAPHAFPDEAAVQALRQRLARMAKV